VPNVSNIAAVSYAGVQVFQQMHRHVFRSLTSSTLAFGTKHYQLLASTSILCRLSLNPKTKNNNIETNMADLCIFDTLENEVTKIEAAMKLFAKRGKEKAAQEISDADE
jgi:hypothetical protein